MRKPLLITLYFILFGVTSSHAQRWYNYGEYLSNETTVGFNNFSIWNDTSAQFGEMIGTTPLYSFSKFTSVGMSFAPALRAWNDVSFYGTTIAVGPSNAYTIDSVRIHGMYQRNNAKPLVKDTLRFGFDYGNGTAATNLREYYFLGPTWTPIYGHDTIYFLTMPHDSVPNTAGLFPGVAATPYVESIVLTNTDTAITFDRTFALATPFTVPAGNVAGMALSFKSGDASYTPYDTVIYASGAYKYGAFSPLLEYAGFTGFAEFPPYNPADSNVGYFKIEGSFDAGFAGLYIPNWAWTAGSPPSATILQYPVIEFHVKCATCAINDTITGDSALCAGSTRALYSSTTGGVWSSGSPGIASIGSLTGIVNGLSGGLATISYTIAGQVATAVVTVYAIPVPSAITGPLTICQGATAHINDSEAGGTWRSVSTGVATIGSTGTITGISGGTTIVSYYISNICGSSLATVVVTVNPLPDTGRITGIDSVCLGDTTTLTDTAAGGSWTSSNALVATVSSGGVVSGVSLGIADIKYSLSNDCGTIAATFPVFVRDDGHCLTLSEGEVQAPGKDGLLVYPNPNDGMFSVDVLSVTDEAVKVTVTNMVGQKIKELSAITNTAYHMDLRLASGIYFLSATTASEQRVVKVVVR